MQFSSLVRKCLNSKFLKGQNEHPILVPADQLATKAAPAYREKPTYAKTAMAPSPTITVAMVAV